MLRAVIVVTVLTLAAAARADGGVGVLVDAGFPDGVHGALLVRPTPRWRLYAGGGHNTLSAGIRAGTTISLLRSRVSPSITVDGGRFFDGDPRFVATALAGDMSAAPAALRQLGYDFASGHLGLEISGTGATFYLHAGVSVVRARLGFREGIDTADGGPVVDVESRATVDVVTPSGRAGLIVYF